MTFFYLSGFFIQNNFFKVYLFILKGRIWVGEVQRERGTGDLKWAQCAQQKARCRAWTHGPRDHDLSQSQMFNRLSHPGAPTFWDILNQQLFHWKYETSRLKDLRIIRFGAPGWLSRLSVWLRLRSWSRGPWVRVPHQALCWQRGACLGFSLSPSPSAPPLLALFRSLSK